MKPTIFLDMDGVLSDLDNGIKKITGYNPDDDIESVNGRSKLFKELLPAYVEANGFANENVCENAHNLVDELYDLYNSEVINLAILTSAGNFYLPNSEVVRQKKKFIERRFPELVEIPFCVTTSGRDKSRLAHPCAMLIDDHISNCERFETAGGWSFQYHPSKINSAIDAINEFIEKVTS